jgi:hypothetical protein
MDNITDFCDEPRLSAFVKLPSLVQQFFYQVSEYCIATGLGNVEMAEKIYGFYMVKDLSSDAKRGVNALLLGIRHLEKLPKKFGDEYPYMKVFAKDNDPELIMTVYYNFSLPDQFFVYDYIGGVSKDLQYHTNDMRMHIVTELGGKNITVSGIVLVFADDVQKVLYNMDIGIVHGNEECIQCASTLKLYDITCDHDGCSTPKAKSIVACIRDSNKRKVAAKCLKMVDDETCLSNIKFRP